MKSMTAFMRAGLVCLIVGLAGCNTPGTTDDNTTPATTTLSDITTATTLETGKTYTVDGTVTVSAKLTIQPGATILFSTYSNYGSELIISESGQIVAEGTADQPITFTSANASPAVADWGGVTVNGNAAVFSYCTFKYSGNGNVTALTITGSGASVTNCTFASNISALDMSSAGENATVAANAFYGNTGGDNQEYPVYINTYVAFADTNTFTNTDGSVKNTYPGICVTGNISTAMTFGNLNAPYIITGAGSTVSTVLTIQPGVTIGITTYSNYGTEITVASTGRIVADGSSAAPITFTSAKACTGGSAARKDWGGVTLKDGPSACSFTYCNFLYAGNGDCATLTLGTASNSSVTNCSFTTVVYGIDMNEIASSTTVSGNTFSDVSGADYVPAP